MKLKTSWYQEKRVILLEVDGDVTLEDLAVINKHLEALLDETSEMVHLIIDMSNKGSLPYNAPAVIRALPFLQRKNLGWFLTVGANPITTFLGIVISNATNIKLRNTKTMQEALSILQRVDASVQIA